MNYSFFAQLCRLWIVLWKRQKMNKVQLIKLPSFTSNTLFVLSSFVRLAEGWHFTKRKRWLCFDNDLIVQTLLSTRKSQVSQNLVQILITFHRGGWLCKTSHFTNSSSYPSLSIHDYCLQIVRDVTHISR